MKERISKNLKNYFNKEIASINYEEIIEQYISTLNLNSLHKEQQLIKLHAELQALGEDQEEGISKVYILYSDSLEHLFSIFFTRYVICVKNDILQIKRALIINAKINRVLDLIKEIKHNSEKYTLKSLKAGKSNVIFYQLKQCPPKISIGEYNQMRLYQSETILKTLELELYHLKSTFLQQSETNFTESLQQEIRNCKLVNLSKLLALTYHQSIPRGYKSHIKHQPDDEALFQIPLPQILKSYKNYRSKSTSKQISCPELFYYTFKKYQFWLNNLQTSSHPGKIGAKHSNFSNMFESTFSTAVEDSEKIIRECKPFNKEKHISILTKRIENLEDYSRKNHWPLLPLTDEKIPALKATFFNHLILNCNIDRSTSHLATTIQTTILYQYYSQQLKRLKKKFNIKDDFPTVPQILDLLSTTVPDDKAYEQLIDRILSNIMHLKKHDLLNISIKKDISNTLCGILNITIDKLNELYFKVDTQVCIEHATLQKDLLEEMVNKNDMRNIPTNPMVFKLLKFFELKIKKYRILNNSTPSHSHIIPPEEETIQPVKQLSFNYKRSDTAVLENIITTLNPYINLLNANTSPKQFVNIITAKDLDTIHEKIYLNCQTNEFKFVIQQIKPLFRTLTYSNIGRSGLFISSNNNTIRESNLTSSVTDNLHSRHKISGIVKSIFKQFGI